MLPSLGRSPDNVGTTAVLKGERIYRPLKGLYFAALLRAGHHNRLLRRLARNDAVLVLLFHHVSPRANRFWPPLHPGLFDDLLGFLGETCEVVSLRDLDQDGARGDGAPKVVLTFDDGFQSFVEYAMPLLTKHRMGANQNVIAACVQSGEPPRDMQLYDILASAPAGLVRQLRVPGFEVEADLDDQRRLEIFGVALGEYLASRSPERRQECWRPIEELRNRLDSVHETPMMSEREVREAAGTHEIGVHSYTHERMDAVSLEGFAEDIERCSAYFADSLRLSPGTYAFPYGRGRDDQVELLRERGFRHVLLTGERASSARARAHPRLTVRGTTRAEVVLRALGHQPRVP